MVSPAACFAVFLLIFSLSFAPGSAVCGPHTCAYGEASCPNGYDSQCPSGSCDCLTCLFCGVAGCACNSGGTCGMMTSCPPPPPPPPSPWHGGGGGGAPSSAMSQIIIPVAAGGGGGLILIAAAVITTIIICRRRAQSAERKQQPSAAIPELAIGVPASAGHWAAAMPLADDDDDDASRRPQRSACRGSCRSKMRIRSTTPPRSWCSSWLATSPAGSRAHPRGRRLRAR